MLTVRPNPTCGYALLGIVLALAAACQAAPAPVEEPAVVTNSSAQTRAELLGFVRSALHDAPVTLADDALVTSSTLIIERVQRRDEAGLLLNGRETGRPEQFELVKLGKSCVLKHVRTEARWTLRKTQCRAVK